MFLKNEHCKNCSLLCFVRVLSNELFQLCLNYKLFIDSTRVGDCTAQHVL